jgi:hypothetical protein
LREREREREREWGKEINIEANGLHESTNLIIQNLTCLDTETERKQNPKIALQMTE